MKVLITALLTLSFTSSSFANCIDAYEIAADKRDSSNGLLLTASVIATVATAVVLADNSNDRNRRSSANNRRSNHNRRYSTRRGRRNHRRHRYGVYYIGTYSSDDRWLGDNSFDEVLMAYNDAVVSVFNDVPYGYSSKLYELEKKVAKKVIKLANKQKLSSTIEDIKISKRLDSIDKSILRDSLINGIERTANRNFCPYGKAYKRNKIIKELALDILSSRS